MHVKQQNIEQKKSATNGEKNSTYSNIFKYSAIFDCYFRLRGMTLSILPMMHRGNGKSEIKNPRQKSQLMFYAINPNLDS